VPVVSQMNKHLLSRQIIERRLIIAIICDNDGISFVAEKLYDFQNGCVFFEE